MTSLMFETYDPSHAPAAVALWNRAMGAAYPLRGPLLRQNLDQNPNFRSSDAVLAWLGNELIGFALLQRYRGEEPCCQGWKSTAWLAAVVVAPGFQRQGIGTRMVTALRQAANDDGIADMRPAGGIFWFFPGIPADLPTAKPFFRSLGFELGSTVHDVRADLTGFDLPERSGQIIARHGMTVRACATSEIDGLLAFILGEFGGNWWYNAKVFFDAGGAAEDWLLLLGEEAIVGMARLHHPGQAVIGAPRYWLHADNAGGLGPIGVAASLRGHGLGLALLHFTLAELQQRGVTDAVADWTDLVEFYAKAGFNPWKRYVTSS